VQFTINVTPYNMRYYIVDDVYPDLDTLVKTIPMSQGEKKIYSQNVKKGCEENIWCAKISIYSYMLSIA